MGSELYHRNQWQELVDVMETSLQELPRALQLCRDECYGPLRLGRRMGFAQVLFVLDLASCSACAVTICSSNIYVVLVRSVQLIHSLRA